jgi:cadmium resistance protein CadD (predicted permease)
MTSDVIAQAAGLFAVTNVDDIVILSLFFAQGTGRRGSAATVVAGQYLAFTAILAVAVGVAFGASFLPEEALPYLGLLPIGIGLRDGWKIWRNRTRGGDDEQTEPGQGGGPTVLKVATTTFANGGDNIGVYAPVFATVGTSGTIAYCVIFLALVGVWCVAGRFVATRPVIARPLSRWGHILMPVVLIAIGLFILINGGAFGL